MGIRIRTGRAGWVAAAVGAVAVLAVAAVPATATATAQAAEAQRGVPSSTTIQRGHALACEGTADGVSVTVDLYENSLHGAHAGIFVETAEGAYRGGFGPQDTRMFRYGRVSAKIALEPAEEEDAAAQAPTAAGAVGAVADVGGTYARTGRPERVHEEIEDAGRIIVTDGLNQQLRTDVSVSVLGRDVPLSCGTAFAFDLLVRTYPAASGGNSPSQ
ncbi:hypothetical protein OG216_36080 [Streptomycetaceae bacterium NBC_01309]